MTLDARRIRFCRMTAPADVAACQALMASVFNDEQHCNLSIPDAWDNDAIYLAAFDGDVMLATTRLVFASAQQRCPAEQYTRVEGSAQWPCYAEVSRVAIRRDYRGVAIQRLVTDYVWSQAAELGATHVIAETRLDGWALHRRIGFSAAGAPFHDPSFAVAGDQPGEPNARVVAAPVSRLLRQAPG